MTTPCIRKEGDLIDLIESRMKLVDSISAALAKRKARRESNQNRSRKSARTRHSNLFSKLKGGGR